MALRDPITSVQELLDHVDERFRPEKRRHAHVRLWFRGHADASWKLEPGVYRDGFVLRDDEEVRLKKERRLAQDFRVESAGLRTEGITDVDLYFLQQHYGMPTRLLDWTSNALTALYFCVCDEKSHGTDGAVFLLDAWKFDKPVEGVATSRRSSFQKAVNIITGWSGNSSSFPKQLFPVRPDRFDPRISLQRAGFTFHVPDQREFTQAQNRFLWKINVAGDSKANLKEQLAVLGVDEFAVYGDLASLSARLNWAYDARRVP